jgi:hypothetical protein
MSYESDNNTGGQAGKVESHGDRMRRLLAPQLPFGGLTVDWNDKNGGKSGSGAEFVQKAIYPKDSILEDLFDYGITQTEGVEAYIIGSILPIAAAILARRTWIKMGNKKIYPNLFVMLAGKAGDRKSSTIDLYRALAQLALPEEAFIPLGFSPETLFDEYDEKSGGRPDKLWIVDDANLVLTDWGKSTNGERNASRFLILYDCCGLSESYRRNKTKTNPNTKRTIAETSTSILFGATFNVACFQGQQVRMGISRRFLNYVGDGLGRTHERPESAKFSRLVRMLESLGAYEGEIDFDPDAGDVWGFYQNENRQLIAATDRLRESELHRLNSAPTQVQKIATIFEFCRAARTRPPKVCIREDTLRLAIDHVGACLDAAAFLDLIANRATVSADAEVLLAKIRIDFGDDRYQPHPETIMLSRSEITAKYASHTGRRGALSSEDLYLRIIPTLIGQGLAKLAKKEGKLEIYAFRKE